jgi:hypothetical protein
METPFEFDTSQALAPALSQIDSTHYLCTYTGPGEDGWAVVLTVNTGNWSISKETPFEFAGLQGQETALAKIDDTNYLCAYSRIGVDYDGWTKVLTVNTGNWTITNQTPFEFDTTCATPALAIVDDTHFLCAYTGPSTDGWSVVLTVDDSNWTISKETPLEFDSVTGKTPALAKIDDNHYLCVYAGSGDDGYVGVIEVCEAIIP